jgi:hypothetical protein
VHKAPWSLDKEGEEDIEATIGITSLGDVKLAQNPSEYILLYKYI